MEELPGHQSDPLTDLPFVTGEDVFTASSFFPTGSIPPDTQAAHDDAIMAKISVEMASIALGGSMRGGMADPGPASLRMVYPGDSIILTGVPPCLLM